MMIRPENSIPIKELINNFDSLMDKLNKPYGYVYFTWNRKLNKKYIGKKVFFNTNNVKLGKKELSSLPITRGRKPTKKQIIKESNWRTYLGSANEVKKWKLEDCERWILSFGYNKTHLTYLETNFLFKYNVLFDDSFVNENILGKFYKNNIISNS